MIKDSISKRRLIVNWLQRQIVLFDNKYAGFVFSCFIDYMHIEAKCGGDSILNFLEKNFRNADHVNVK